MKVAVVGSGVSDLAATWLLNEHSDHEVHLYESDSRPGGHAHTVRFYPPDNDKSSNGVDVDTYSSLQHDFGPYTRFKIVFNPTTYPNFLRFLNLLGPSKVVINPTEMTFSVSRDSGAFEWAGDNLRTVFCQLKRIFDPEMWRLIYDVARFNASARRLVASWKNETQGKKTRIDFSIGEYLDREGYSQSFRDNYLIPMTAAIWSTPPDTCALEFPARTLITFMSNHHLLQVTGKPSWLTIKDGSQNYVQAILEKLPDSQLHLSTPVLSVSSTDSSKVIVSTAAGQTDEFDHVILACHSNEALKILSAGNVQEKEKNILETFQWNRNHVILHSDEALMPRSRLAWSCWNYLTFSTMDEKGTRKANCDQVSLTYGMNDLQHIPESKHGPVLVTLNPPFEPDPSKTRGKWYYDHPVVSAEAMKAQHQIKDIQGTRRISYAGAYLNFGFHEDGFTSGLLAATRYAPVLPPESIRPPFEFEVVEGSSWDDGSLHKTSVENGGMEVRVVAVLFDLMEWSGLRVLLGFVLGSLVGVLGKLVGL